MSDKKSKAAKELGLECNQCGIIMGIGNTAKSDFQALDNRFPDAKHFCSDYCLDEFVTENA